jgi:HSP20 family protein
MFSLFGNQTERSLFDEFERLQSDMDRMFGGWPATSIRSGRAGAWPAINIGATPDDVHVFVYAPGLSAAAIDLSLQQNVLTISGARKLPEQKEGNWYLRERFDGEFRRAVTLPEDVDPERIEAKYRDGVLHVCIARRATVSPRRITIN